jgi:hypothetical protein
MNACFILPFAKALLVGVLVDVARGSHGALELAVFLAVPEVRAFVLVSNLGGDLLSAELKKEQSCGRGTHEFKPSNLALG